MRTDCDVAVVGAGPAGSRTARNLARAGLRVRLIEEHRRIGEPSHCSGLISPRTLAEAGVPAGFAIHAVTGAFVHTQSGAEAALGGGAVRAVAIDRVALDRELARQAQNAGAELVTARMVHAERVNSHVELRLQRGDRESVLKARLVVGADGTFSRVARTMGMAPPRMVAYNLGIEGRLRARRDDFVHVFVGSELAPGWFGWIIPTGDGRARVGIGSTSAKPIACYRRMVAAFPDLFDAIEPCRMYGGTIPLEFAPRSFGDSVLLAGDAAGQVKPFSGGGIYTGLVGARHATAAALLAFQRGDFSSRTLSLYERSWKREIGGELIRSLRLRNFGLALTDSHLDSVVAALRSPVVAELAARHGDIDYPSRVLLRVARSLPALGVLASTLARRPGAAFALARAHFPFAI